MKNATQPSYSKLSKALSKTAHPLHPSQVHGLVSGLLCGPDNKQAAWERHLVSGTPTEEMHELLQSMVDQGQAVFNAFSFEFQLLLPDDNESLSNRAEALTLWCQGYLTGLKLADIPIVDRPPSEVTEAIHDIVEIAKMNFEDVVASEEDEKAYVQLVEFVRMAVTLIYENLHGNSSTCAESSS